MRDFADGLYAEAGGEGIEHNHDYMLRYVEEFGLSLYLAGYGDLGGTGSPSQVKYLRHDAGKHVRLQVNQHANQNRQRQTVKKHIA